MKIKLFFISLVLFVFLIPTCFASEMDNMNNYLDYQELNDKNKKPYILYDYISNEQATGEVQFQGGNTFSNAEKIGNKIKFYTYPRFWRDEYGYNWVIKRATATPEIFNEFSAQAKTNPDNFSIIKTVQADTYYTSAGDGYVGYSNSNWSTARNGTTANDYNINSAGTDASLQSTTYYCYRSLFPADTSAIDDGATIDSASLFVYNGGGGSVGSSWTVSVVSTTQASPLSIGAEDYDEFGDTDLGNTTYDPTSAGWLEIEIDNPNTNISKTSYTLLGLRETNHDLADSAPTAVEYSMGLQTSEGANPPYYEITLGGGEGEGEASTTTIGFTYPENMCINNDLSVLCGMTIHYETSTETPDWVQYSYYHIPFFVYLCLAPFLLYLLHRIFIEIIIRLRNNK